MTTFGTLLSIPPTVAGMAGAAIFHRVADALLVRGDEGYLGALSNDDLAEVGWPENPFADGALMRAALIETGLANADGGLPDWDTLAGGVLRDRGVSRGNSRVSAGNSEGAAGVSAGNSQTPMLLPEVGGSPGGAGGVSAGNSGPKEVPPPHTPPLQERPSGSSPEGSSSSAPEAEKNQKAPPAGARAQDREPPWDALLQSWNTVATEHRLPRVRRLDAERKKLLGPWYRACGSDFAVAERAMFEAAKAYGGMEGDKAYGLFNMIRPSTRQKWITAAEEALDRPHADTVAGDFRDDLSRELEEAYPPIPPPPPAPPEVPLAERIDDYLNRLFADKALALPEGYAGADPRRVRPGDTRASAAAQREIRAHLTQHPERIPA